MQKYHSTCLDISCVASLTKVTVSLNPEKNLRNGSPTPRSLSFFLFLQNRISSKCKICRRGAAAGGGFGAGRVFAALQTYRGSLHGIGESVGAAAGEVHPAAVRCDCCTHRVRLHRSHRHPTPDYFALQHSWDLETGGGCGCQRLRIQGIVEFIASYILSTYFALNFGLGWAAALCSSGRR